MMSRNGAPLSTTSGLQKLPADSKENNASERSASNSAAADAAACHWPESIAKRAK